jgi:hypothetical protein
VRRLIFLVGALALCACTDSTGPIATLDGTYDLKTVNGAALPYTTFQNATQKDELLGDVIIASDGSFSQFTSNRVTINGHVDDGMSLNSGSYAIHGTAVTFTSLSGTPWTGTISGDTLTMPFTVPTGGTGVYVRREP